MKLWGFFQLKQSLKEYRLCCLINYILSVGRNEQTSGCTKKKKHSGGDRRWQVRSKFVNLSLFCASPLTDSLN